MEAVIATGGKQYRVTPGQVISVEKLPGDAGGPVEPLRDRPEAVPRSRGNLDGIALARQGYGFALLIDVHVSLAS